MPAAATFAKSPYKGLTYGKGWGFNKQVDGTGQIVEVIATQLRGPTDIGVDSASSVQSYQMKYFDWYGGVTTAVRILTPSDRKYDASYPRVLYGKSLLTLLVRIQSSTWASM